ncbi:MAG TPA: hypothetical protein VEL82_00125 [Thermoplasmata archaeon]|nr:hypothetical protein [Thermoplasmata archaeon]
MSAVPLSELDRLARTLGGDRHDAFSERALARAYEEYRSRPRPALAAVSLVSDGRPFPSLAALLMDPAARFDSGELTLASAPAPGSAWRFLVPFERLVFSPDGSVELHPADGAPAVRGIARALLREHYLVRSQAEEEQGASGGPRVELRGLRGTLAEAARVCREARIIPFGVAILVYLADERVRFEFDAVHTTLLPDPRAGRLSPTRRTRRSARLSWAVDGYVARSDLSVLGARCLEILVESPGLTSVELSYVFGGVRELVDSALQGLVQHGIISFDHRTGTYRARLEAFQAAGPAPSLEPGGPPGDPALRTSVQELIAAADARATCPLCGRPLPAGPKTILCDECAARVGAA